MKRAILLTAALTVCALAIDIPRIGFARDAQGRVKAINGIAGNFVLGEIAEGALAFSWNGSYGIRKTDSALHWLDGSGATVATFAAPAGDAVIGFGDGQAAYIFSKSAGMLCQLKSTQWSTQQVPVALSPDEEVLAVTGDRDSVTIAVRRNEAIFVAAFNLASGSRLTEFALVRTASHLLFLNDGALAGVDGSTLWIGRADGSQWSVDTGIALNGLAWMGRDWMVVLADDRQFVLRVLGNADPKVYLLPQAVIE